MITRIALAAALIATASTISLASEFDSNPANRYPAYAEPFTIGPATQGSFRTSAVSLGAGEAQTGQPVEIEHDRASSPYAGGVG
jgi:hypothetical protein